jgi:hypothetical protein
VTRFLEATRERFLMAIAAVLPPERFIELHFFPAIRQGGVESGVAVIAAHPEQVAVPVIADAAPVEEPEEARAEEPLAEGDLPNEPPKPRRYTVYAAKYKLALKGPDRGKWECSVVAEADAPLVTVETVVRGVQRRSGDAEEPERMSGEEARNFVLTSRC